MLDIFENVSLLVLLLMSGVGITVTVLVLFLKLMDYIDSHDIY